MQKCTYACGSPEHSLSRRGFLGGVTAGALGFAGLVHPATARQLHKEQKHVLVFFMNGGLSQLESWDPKPGTNTGGPFQTIATSVPGVHICELLPYTAKQMHRLALVRGINTRENEHGRGAVIMQTGRRPEPALPIRTSAPSSPNCSVPATAACPAICTSRRRRRRFQQAGRRFPRSALRLGDPRRRQAARQPAPPRDHHRRGRPAAQRSAANASTSVS